MTRAPADQLGVNRTFATIPTSMGIDEDIQHWLRFAESDMVSAEALHRARQELNALFHLQQAVEKTLKALLLRKSEVQPPRIHGLRGLSERCGLRLTKKQALLMENLSEYYVESRYPGDWDAGHPRSLPRKWKGSYPRRRNLSNGYSRKSR